MEILTFMGYIYKLHVNSNDVVYSLRNLAQSTQRNMEGYAQLRICITVILFALGLSFTCFYLLILPVFSFLLSFSFPAFLVNGDEVLSPAPHLYDHFGF